MLKIKRIYQDYANTDGYRILIDRLWPRGISKSLAKIDYWYKEIAPSNQLRKEFNHQPELFPEFERKYLIELDNNLSKAMFLSLIKKYINTVGVTLLYSAKNEKYNQAVVLKKWIEKNLK